ncbi:MAG: DUF4157 domain-containing protein, partial [bacterium]|nr:DUF4157 domain-containing protein [bacterium]
MRKKSAKIRIKITHSSLPKISKAVKSEVLPQPQTKPICPCEGDCPACREPIQTKELPAPKDSLKKTTPVKTGLQDQIQTIKGSGQPLPETTRNYFEPRFGKDLGNIRIHAGTKANDTAADLHAQAFTTGNNVAFAHGHYSPETIAGKKLLAHEIAHTMQQQATQNTGETLRLRPQPGPFTVS